MKIKSTKLIKRDIIRGFYNNRFKFITVTLLFMIVIYLSAINIEGQAFELGILYENVNFIDLFFSIFKGSDYDKSSIPIIWFLIYIYNTYLIGSYCYDDLSKDSSHIILRMKNRQSIWTSKVIWMILTVIAFYAILLLLIALFSVLIFNISFEWSEFSKATILDLIQSDYNSGKFILLTILVYILSSIVISTLQMLVSLMLKPKYIYIVNVSILVASLHIKKFLVPIQGSLILRQNIFNPMYQITPINTIIYSLLSFIIILIVGYKYIEKFDILVSQKTD